MSTRTDIALRIARLFATTVITTVHIFHVIFVTESQAGANDFQRRAIGALGSRIRPSTIYGRTRKTRPGGQSPSIRISSESLVPKPTHQMAQTTFGVAANEVGHMAPARRPRLTAPRPFDAYDVRQ